MNWLQIQYFLFYFFYTVSVIKIWSKKKERAEIVSLYMKVVLTQCGYCRKYGEWKVSSDNSVIWLAERQQEIVNVQFIRGQEALIYSLLLWEIMLRKIRRSRIVDAVSILTSVKALFGAFWRTIHSTVTNFSKTMRLKILEVMTKFAEILIDP